MDCVKKRLNRQEASKYLEEEHGVRRSPATLAKYATIGGGPIFRKVNRGVIYDIQALDEYAARIVSDPRASTADAA